MVNPGPSSKGLEWVTTGYWLGCQLVNNLATPPWNYVKSKSPKLELRFSSFASRHPLKEFFNFLKDYLAIEKRLTRLFITKLINQ